MRIVIQNSARVWGGNEKWALLLATGLARRGHNIIVSCRAGSMVEQRFRASGIHTTHQRPGGYVHLPRAFAFHRFLRRERVDVLLLTSWAGIFWGAWAGRRAGARVIVRLGIVRVPDRRRYLLPFRHVDALIVNASAIRDTWVRAVPSFPRDAVHVILNAVPSAGVDRTEAARWLLSEIDAPDDVLIIGAAGHVARRKGFDILIDALARVESRIHAVIAGDGPELAPLRMRAERLGVADRIRFLGHREDVPHVLAGCDIFVLTSRNEGMANVMLEAMAAGTPVIATDISGVREVLDPHDGRPPAGWVIPPDDPGTLASTLSDVAARVRARDHEVCRRSGEARRRMVEEFGLDRMIDQAERVLAGM